LYSLGKIEEMLLGARSPRVCENPMDRAPLVETSLDERAAQLAERVRYMIQMRESLKASSTHLLKNPRLSFPFARLAAVAIFFLMIPGSPVYSKPASPFTVLKIRTIQWLSLRLNGMPLGFAPKDVLLKPGRHRLDWETATKKGSLFIDARSKGPVILSDGHFGI
jgi:hypothetical protein